MTLSIYRNGKMGKAKHVCENWWELSASNCMEIKFSIKFFKNVEWKISIKHQCSQRFKGRWGQMFIQSGASMQIIIIDQYSFLKKSYCIILLHSNRFRFNHFWKRILRWDTLWMSNYAFKYDGILKRRITPPDLFLEFDFTCYSDEWKWLEIYWQCYPRSEGSACHLHFQSFL